MYYLKDRVDALTTFIPALVEEVNYVLELLGQYLMTPSDNLAKRLSDSNFSYKTKTNPNESIDYDAFEVVEEEETKS